MARRRAVSPAILPPGHILFIGAHPDDEVVAAPLLGALCAEGGATCSFLTLTRGEGGICGLPVCSPDLGTVREREMLASAALFRGQVTQWSFPDVMGDFTGAWGPRDALLDRITGAITIERPDVVITFDPAHGTTCHPAHRETGRVVIDAVARLGPSAPPLYLLETMASLDTEAYRFGAGAAPAMVFDASPYWQFIIDAASAHASQFSAAQLDALRATPVTERKVWIARASGIRQAIAQCE